LSAPDAAFAPPGTQRPGVALLPGSEGG
jgi:hypothetical protein